MISSKKALNYSNIVVFFDGILGNVKLPFRSSDVIVTFPNLSII